MVMLRELPIYESTEVALQEQTPRIVYDSEVDPQIIVNAHEIAGTMRAMEISEKAISNTIVYLDAQSHYCVNGSVWPKMLGRLRHIRNPELRKAPGSIVRLSTVMAGKRRRIDDINRTLVHELKHVAQIDQKDSSLVYGQVTYWGISALGALAANKLVRNSPRIVPRLAVTFGGLLLGSHAGYRLAPHERHARASANHTTIAAVSVDSAAAPTSC